jgi:hypothetical protein
MGRPDSHGSPATFPGKNEKQFNLCALILVGGDVFAILPLPIPTMAPDPDIQPGFTTVDTSEPLPGYTELYTKSRLREMSCRIGNKNKH